MLGSSKWTSTTPSLSASRNPAVEEGLEETGLDEDDTVQTVAALPCASDVEKDVVSAAIEKGAV